MRSLPGAGEGDVRCLTARLLAAGNTSAVEAQRAELVAAEGDMVVGEVTSTTWRSGSTL